MLYLLEKLLGEMISRSQRFRPPAATHLSPGQIEISPAHPCLRPPGPLPFLTLPLPFPPTVLNSNRACKYIPTRSVPGPRSRIRIRPRPLSPAPHSLLLRPHAERFVSSDSPLSESLLSSSSPLPSPLCAASESTRRPSMPDSSSCNALGKGRVDQ